MRRFRFLPATPTLGCLPLTATRPLGTFPVGNLPLKDHQLRALAGPWAPSGPVEVYPHAWLEADDVAAFMNDAQASALVDGQRAELLLRPGATGQPCVAAHSFLIRFAWDLLVANERALKVRTDWTNQGDCHASLYVDGRLSVGAGTRILPGVVIEGDVVIGAGCKVGPNCYIRGATTVGDGCHVGQAVELKHAILLGKTNVGHLSYVGDSVLGEKVNFGAGTIISNLRHDGKAHRTMVEGQLIDTGRRKLGAIIGDGVHTGIHTAIYPGRKIWPGQTTRPAEVVDRDLV